MYSTEVAVRRLEQIEARLREQDAAELANEVGEVIQYLRVRRGPRETRAQRRGDLFTTGEAAEILGIRSLNTVKKWATDGVLEGRRIGRRIMITRESVEQLLQQPTVAEERAREAEQRS